MPLNAALMLEGAFVAGSPTLTDEAGQPVEFTSYAGPTPGCPGTSADLVPARPLRPNTRYVLAVEPLYPDWPGGGEAAPPSLTFTTGTMMLPDEEPAPPSANASVVFDVETSRGSCASGDVFTCVGVTDWEGVEVILRRGDETMLRWIMRTGDGTSCVA